MERILADASWLIAELNPKDPDHVRALALRPRRTRLVTTDLILTEYLNAFSATHLRIRAAQETHAWYTGEATRVFHIDEGMFQQALLLYTNRPDKGWSLTDCASFLLMRQLGIARALTADRHFIQAGFEALLV